MMMKKNSGMRLHTTLLLFFCPWTYCSFTSSGGA